MKRFALYCAITGLSVVLVGCGVAPVQTVMVPLPVECRVELPTRPAMPTESLASNVDLDRFAAAAMAEIELREGYEGVLLAVLAQCAKPVFGKRVRSK